MADQLNANTDCIKTEILESVARSSVVLESVTNPSVNATTDHSKSDADLLHLINELKAQVESLQTATPSPPPGRPGTFFRPRRNTSNYYWSHGTCGHKGVDCKNKRSGH